MTEFLSWFAMFGAGFCVTMLIEKIGYDRGYRKGQDYIRDASWNKYKQTLAKHHAEAEYTTKSRVIYGERASGKTTMARMLASVDGTYVETSLYEIMRPFADIFSTGPVTVIVEVGMLTSKARQAMKTLAGSKDIAIAPRGKPVYTVPAPKFIFIVDLTHISTREMNNDRRFQFIAAELPCGVH